MHHPCMPIADVIRAARLRANLRQAAVARHCKVAPSAVSQWESGTTQPSLDNRVSVAGLLGIPITELLPEGPPAPRTEPLQPQEIILVEKFRQLTPPLREAYLRMLIVQAGDLEKA